MKRGALERRLWQQAVEHGRVHVKQLGQRLRTERRHQPVQQFKPRLPNQASEQWKRVGRHDAWPARRRLFRGQLVPLARPGQLLGGGDPFRATLVEQDAQRCAQLGPEQQQQHQGRSGGGRRHEPRVDGDRPRGAGALGWGSPAEHKELAQGSAGPADAPPLPDGQPKRKKRKSLLKSTNYIAL